MARRSRPPSKFLGFLLDRKAEDPAWIHAFVQQLHEVQACLPAQPPPKANVGDSARLGRPRPPQRRLFDERVRSHYLMQPELEAGRAVQELG